MTKRKSSIIIDTSALVSLVSSADSNHARAVAVSRELARTVTLTIIPGEILTEFINVFGKKAGHKEAIKKGKKILEASDYEIVETNTEIRTQAFALYEKQTESVSFTDCLVMAFAHYYETRDIFGFDEVFKKNGYMRLGFEKRA